MGTLSRYQRAEIQSSSPQQLVVMTYRELLRNLRRGRLQIEERDLAGKADSFGRARAILLELMATLDMGVEGGLPQRLASLYGYFLREIEDVSRTLDADRLGPTIDMVARLEEAWSSAASDPGGPA